MTVQPTGAPEERVVRLDAHVHLYAGFDREAWLDAAARNLAVAENAVVGVLALTETARDDAFTELLAAGTAGAWQIAPGAEPGLAIARRERDGCRLWLVQGFQAVTAEGLEVLAIGTTRRPADGEPLATTLAAVRAAGGIPAMPWGFGKWWGARGRVLEQCLASAAPDAPLLGDNGGRPRGWPTPGPLRRWRAAGRLLNGSDPLPLAAGVERVGSYGVTWRQRLDPDRPLASLKAALGDPTTRFAPWNAPGGGRVGPFRFVRDQIALRLAKLRGAGKRSLAHDTRTPDIHTAGPDYARRFQGPVGDYLLDVQAHATAAVLPPPPEAGTARALDVGGGHGQLTPLLLEHGYEIWVQGSAPVWAARLERLRVEHPDRIHLVTADLWRLPFADRSFDLVTGFRLLAHVEATEALLHEMCRVSRNTVVVDYAPLWSANLLEPLLFRLKRLLEGNTRPFFCYTRRQLAGWLGTQGFGAVRQAKQFWLPMVVHRKLGSPARSAALEAFGRRLGLTALLGAPVVLAARRGGA